MKWRVRLAPLSAEDGDEFVEAALRSRKLHAPWVSPPLTQDRFVAMLGRSQGASARSFVARRVDTGELAGYVGISEIVRGGFHSAYMGYYAFAGHEGQGLMREALQLAVRTAFRDLKLHRLEANIQPGNRASIALVKSAGFRKEGFSPRYLKIRGRWRDHERWAILADC